MRHINRRCSASNTSLHQMLNRCLFSALPKASEDLLSVRRQTGRAFHVAGPQQWNPRWPMSVLLLGTNSWPAAAEQTCRRPGSVSTGMQTSAIRHTYNTPSIRASSREKQRPQVYYSPRQEKMRAIIIKHKQTKLLYKICDLCCLLMLSLTCNISGQFLCIAINK